jgi:hypothetical protein
MALTVKKIERGLQDGRHHDGHGLYLQVTQSGSASWSYRYKVNGKERWMGLGGLYDTDLDEARERAWNARQLLKKDKIDPLNAKKAARVETAKQITFEKAARDYQIIGCLLWSLSGTRQTRNLKTLLISRTSTRGKGGAHA